MVAPKKKRWRHSPLYLKIMNSREYRVARAQYMSEHPLCERCQAEGFVTPATELHHLTEIESATTEVDAWRLGTSLSNMQALCRRCHDLTHRERHSHSREAHQQREQDRLAAWMSKHKPKSYGEQADEYLANLKRRADEEQGEG